ncbi:ERYTHROCYTE MEMBRANE PROTEIN PFEMP3, related [Eimeria tenella]|uniref:ERYTHROCYTE MEMBRANE PROTEIN PFEMP3, related n=1 Tax=Eimeria tenella TaxID=5802 RepID=U6KP33_EIMTE|nr:ERYTHROCYTE MEMBRANE PROTEIN PFEMP3, related [Eimeria tenella]CDJ39736.1 ERYTHROCYTE MEMBRANE PROTEIN PFEMP3, related [Eimeria tenella]|eukprot:XP_013230489.1 ERYTHROCYTE MEMBRANE PROTEIN PFEMP3, related [Eimeria tenella]
MRLQLPEIPQLPPAQQEPERPPRRDPSPLRSPSVNAHRERVPRREHLVHGGSFLIETAGAAAGFAAAAAARNPAAAAAARSSAAAAAAGRGGVSRGSSPLSRPCAASSFLKSVNSFNLKSSFFNCCQDNSSSSSSSSSCCCTPARHSTCPDTASAFADTSTPPELSDFSHFQINQISPEVPLKRYIPPNYFEDAGYWSQPAAAAAAAAATPTAAAAAPAAAATPTAAAAAPTQQQHEQRPFTPKQRTLHQQQQQQQLQQQQQQQQYEFPERTDSPDSLLPVVGRSIGLDVHRSLPPVQTRVYGGLDEVSAVRDESRTMFSRQRAEAAAAAAAAAAAQQAAAKEIIETVVPKTKVQQRIKYVDLEFVQNQQKFVEVPEVFYSDVIVEVPQVVEVVKIVPKEEIKENIIYVPRFETKYIPKYVEVPIIKIVDRYEEVQEIQEVLKPVPKQALVDYEDVAVYRQKEEPRIIKEEIINHKPHFINIPLPFEQQVVKVVEQPYFVNRYRDNLLPLLLQPKVAAVFNVGPHTQQQQVPVAAPYLVTHTSHQSRPLLQHQLLQQQQQQLQQQQQQHLQQHVGPDYARGSTPPYGESDPWAERSLQQQQDHSPWLDSQYGAAAGDLQQQDEGNAAAAAAAADCLSPCASGCSPSSFFSCAN